MKTLFSQVLDLYVFNLVILNDDGVEAAESRHTLSKDKVIVTYGNLGVCSLLKTNSMMVTDFNLKNHRFTL